MADVTLTPYNYAKAIVPSDTIDIWQRAPVNQRRLTDAIQVGTGGTVSCVLEDDSVVTLTLISGQVFPIRCKRVNSTGTGALLLVALWHI